MDNFFYRLGYGVARNTKRTLLVSLILVVACSFGFANFKIETEGERKAKGLSSTNYLVSLTFATNFGTTRQGGLLRLCLRSFALVFEAPYPFYCNETFVDKYRMWSSI